MSATNIVDNGLLGRINGLLGGAATFVIAVTGFLRMVNSLRKSSKSIRDIDPEQEEFDRLIVKRNSDSKLRHARRREQRERS